MWGEPVNLDKYEGNFITSQVDPYKRFGFALNNRQVLDINEGDESTYVGIEPLHSYIKYEFGEGKEADEVYERLEILPVTKEVQIRGIEYIPIDNGNWELDIFLTDGNKIIVSDEGLEKSDRNYRYK